MGVGVGSTQGSMHGVGVGLEVKVWGIFFFFFFFFFFKNDTLFSFQSRTEDLTHNVLGLCPRLSIQVSSVYCSKIDLSFQNTTPPCLYVMCLFLKCT